MTIFSHVVHYSQLDGRQTCLYNLEIVFQHFISAFTSCVDFELWPENGGQWWKAQELPLSEVLGNQVLIRQTFSFIFQFIMPPSSQTELRQQMRSLSDQRHEIDILLQIDDSNPDAMHKKKMLDIDMEMLRRLINNLPNLGKELRCLLDDGSTSEREQDVKKT